MLKKRRKISSKKVYRNTKFSRFVVNGYFSEASKQIDTTNIANVSQIHVCLCNCNVLENDLFILHTYFELKRYEHVKINKRVSYSIHRNV